jgi:NAD-dependent deacetylase
MVDEILIHKAAEMLATSQHIAVLTGAGVSKESGVPTFRDAMDGLWARFDPHQLATAEAFKENPKLVWDWYEYRRELVRGAHPNAGHVALAQLEDYFPGVTVITQNVDDLHEQAGSTDVVHLHGKIAQSKCFYHCQGEPTLIDISTLTWDKESGPPSCPHCGHWVRPDVVWFGEMLPMDALNRARTACATSAVMLVIGTSGLVNPAASLPSYARGRGAKIIEINPLETPITEVAHLYLGGASGDVLPRVLNAILERA